jgi:hypothetical protein
MRPSFSRLARRVWILDKKARRDTALKALAIETDPAKRGSLQALADRYQAMLNAGSEEAEPETLRTSRRRA